MSKFIELTEGEEVYLINTDQIVCVMPVPSSSGCTIVLTNFINGRNVLNFEVLDYYTVKRLITE